MPSMEDKAFELSRLMMINAPVRTKYISPKAKSYYGPPGHLKMNAMRVTGNGQMAKLDVGNEDVPYAVYTETRSKKKNWQAKSRQQFEANLKSRGWIKV